MPFITARPFPLPASPHNSPADQGGTEQMQWSGWFLFCVVLYRILNTLSSTINFAVRGYHGSLTQQFVAESPRGDGEWVAKWLNGAGTGREL